MDNQADGRIDSTVMDTTGGATNYDVSSKTTDPTDSTVMDAAGGATNNDVSTTMSVITLDGGTETELKQTPTQPHGDGAQAQYQHKRRLSTTSVTTCTDQAAKQRTDSTSVTTCTDHAAKQRTHSTSVTTCTDHAAKQRTHSTSVTTCTDHTAKQRTDSTSVTTCTDHTAKQRTDSTSVTTCTDHAAELQTDSVSSVAASRKTSTLLSFPLYHEKPTVPINSNTILLQPEMHFFKQEQEKKLHDAKFPKLRADSNAFCEEELVLIRRFPWLAERLKLAWAQVKDAEKQQQQLKAAKREHKQAVATSSILKQRTPEAKPRLKLDDDSAKEEQPKVVFSRNMPLFVYSSTAKKAIRVGGDLNERNMTEEIYKAIEYNPELKKVTLDIQDICKPGSDKTIHLAVSYLSATTNYNPLVISEHMARYSGKKEASIKYIVSEIERRLLAQRQVREQRDEKWRRQVEEIVRARLEAQEKENDIMVAKRQLEDSRKENLGIMTIIEREQERRRRIHLRTKAIPVADRIKMPVSKTKRTTQRQQRLPVLK